MLRKLLSRMKKPKVTGIRICLLQQKPNRLSSEQLNTAMKRAWRGEYDPQRFVVVSVGEDCSLLKIDDFHLTIRHVDRSLPGTELGGEEVPGWAVHSSHTSIAYKYPAGIPKGEMRDAFYGLLGLLVAELVTPDTTGFFFGEEKMFLPNNQEVLEKFRSGKPLNPSALAG